MRTDNTTVMVKLYVWAVTIKKMEFNHLYANIEYYLVNWTYIIYSGEPGPDSPAAYGLYNNLDMQGKMPASICS